jgi:hypothetical protein
MSIDDLLRDALRDDSYALPGWPDATARVRAGISRRRRRRAATVAAALAAVTVLAVPIAVSQLAASPPLQGPGVAVTPSPGQVIPWLERRVGPVTPSGPQSQTLVAFIDSASTVDPGTSLDYVVSLENRSDTDLRLDPCPVFVQQLGPDGGTYLFNCTIAILPAHSWIRLRMRLSVGADAPTGLQELSWSTAIDGQVASASTFITVR